eukprot:11066266-Karenia_brevis.AAC.1
MLQRHRPVLSGPQALGGGQCRPLWHRPLTKGAPREPKVHHPHLHHSAIPWNLLPQAEGGPRDREKKQKIPKEPNTLTNYTKA